MTSPTSVYLWELWRRSRWQLLGRLTFVIGYILLLAMINRVDADGPMSRFIRGLILVMMIPSNIFSPTWMGNFVSGQAGFAFRGGFIRPVKTWWLVVLPALYAVVAGIVVYCLQATVVFAVTGERLPLLMPSLIVGTGITWVIAALWIPSTSTGRVLAITIVVVVFSTGAYFFHASRAGSDTLLMAAGRPDYLAMHWPLVAILLPSAVVAVAATVTSVERQRHGDSLFDIGFSNQSVRTESKPACTNLLPAWPRSKYQTVLAQFWFEWKRCRSTVLPMALIIPILLFAVQTIGPMIGENWNGAEVIWIAALAVSPLIYQLVAAQAALGGQASDGTTGLTQFDFVRPLPCDQMIAIKILAVFVSSLLGFLFIAAAAGLHSLTGQTETWRKITELVNASAGSVPTYWWLIGGICWLLLYICSTSTMFAWMLLAAKHPRWVSAWFAFIFIHIVFVMLNAKSGWNLKPLWTFYGYVGAVAIIAGAAYLLRRSIQSRAMGRSLLIATACLWIVYVGTAVYIFAQANPPTQVPTAAIVFTAACLLIPLAAAVVSPLALATHRHG